MFSKILDWFDCLGHVFLKDATPRTGKTNPLHNVERLSELAARISIIPYKSNFHPFIPETNLPRHLSVMVQAQTLVGVCEAEEGVLQYYFTLDSSRANAVVTSHRANTFKLGCFPVFNNYEEAQEALNTLGSYRVANCIRGIINLRTY